MEKYYVCRVWCSVDKVSIGVNGSKWLFWSLEELRNWCKKCCREGSDVLWFECEELGVCWSVVWGWRKIVDIGF